MRILASPAFCNEKVNPYNALLYQEINNLDAVVTEYSHQKALVETYDVIHFHWPDGYINQKNIFKSLQRIFLFAGIILVAKAKGSKIVWTVHNVVPHDAYRPKLSHLFMRWFINRCDGFIFMSDESQSTFLSLYAPRAHSRSAIIPHGHYRGSYPAAINQAEAKAGLGLPSDKKILLFFGMIKPYKNIDSLIEVYQQTKAEDYVLVIAGNPDSQQLRESLTLLKKDHPDIYLFLKFIPDQEIQLYLSAADAVILPYKAILNSGALLLALSFNKPVIATHMGTIIALQRELGEEWVQSYEGDIDSAKLTAALNRLDRVTRPHICPLERYNWDQLAQSTLALYRNLV